MKKYINISGFNIRSANRGNAALTYGTVSFLENKGLLKDGMEIIRYHSFNNPFKLKNLLTQSEIVTINGKQYVHKEIPIFSLEKMLIKKFGIILPFTPFGRTVNKIALEAADYGGDGFSDIYGDETFLERMRQTFLLSKANVPLVMLPQTIGPFKKKQNYDLAVKIMRYAREVYVRDEKFIPELEKLGIKYTLTKDISFFMKPEPWDIEIKEKAVGLNVSGLAYGNRFKGLEGQFDSYPKLVSEIIENFRKKGCTIYLIPHSYTYNKPNDNDDMLACREAYARLSDKSNVVLVDKDMTSPQVKYVISRMTFFIGARMHANFAAIYTGVPVFGTAYSYKFEGAFNANGLNGKEQTEMINNLKNEDIDAYVRKIDSVYAKYCE
ncbi:MULTISPECIES: polysaccharide pyruvyl transferase family protein [unclassified Bacteroides]|uniref:polysaccharide pyruvyl transferase family protein n=1 Tax=unclassified Bacteroides TaxID=2646097 RepID=UPI0004E169AB|nr:MULTISPECIES: polysaccharide pyruvyl transferase family protein [unclassified Bacteroides]